jgi:hypothetical protein
VLLLPELLALQVHLRRIAAAQRTPLEARQNLHPNGRIAPEVVGGKLLLVQLVVFGLGVTLGSTGASKESSASPAFWEAKGFATLGAAATR